MDISQKIVQGIIKPLILELIKGPLVPGAGIEPAQPLLATGF
jgi:hypothetical protein